MSLLDSFIEDQLLAAELKQTLSGTPTVGLQEIFLAIRTDSDGDPGDPQNPKLVGDGTRQNPFAANTAIEFNSVVGSSAFTTNMAVHLGPGLFRTEGGGGSGSVVPLRLFDGMRIVGSGMFKKQLRARPPSKRSKHLIMKALPVCSWDVGTEPRMMATLSLIWKTRFSRFKE
jgi:hypothetical protein